MSEENFVSFVVIAYNEAANIARSLTAIAQLDGLGEHEIIVVDDGSSDDTGLIAADIARRNPRVQLIQLTANRGRGYARSRGVAAARGALIATVDADIILPWAGWRAAGPRSLTMPPSAGSRCPTEMLPMFINTATCCRAWYQEPQLWPEAMGFIAARSSRSLA